jgi:uncharacterized protein with GYD domain
MQTTRDCLTLIPVKGRSSSHAYLVDARLEAGRLIREKPSNQKEEPMTTFVTLYNFTEQGLKNIKDTVKRTEAAKKAAEAQGVRVKEVLWVEGQYDLVVVSESSNDTKATAFALSTLKLGNVRGQTLRAFTAAEMQKS